MLKPYFTLENIRLYHGDAYAVLPQLDLREAALLLTDPPYGAGLSGDYASRFHSTPGSGWWANTDRSTVTRHTEIQGDDTPFDPAPLLALPIPKKILWGGNHYASRLPDSGGWLVWDKRRGVENAEWPMSDGELAWTNIRNAVRIFRHRWFGLLRDSELHYHVHPTQKPVALMHFCIQFAKLAPNSLIIDPFMGSGPAAQAAYETGMRYIGIESEERYVQTAIARFRHPQPSFHAALDAL